LGRQDVENDELLSYNRRGLIFTVCQKPRLSSFWELSEHKTSRQIAVQYPAVDFIARKRLEGVAEPN